MFSCNRRPVRLRVKLVMSEGSPTLSEKAVTKACPYCAETIRAAAVLCRHCHMDLVTGERVEVREPVSKPAAVSISAEQPIPRREPGAPRVVRWIVGCFVAAILIISLTPDVEDYGSREKPARTPTKRNVAPLMPKIWATTTANIRGGPGTDFPVVGELKAEHFTYSQGKEGGWHKLAGDRWIHESVVATESEREQSFREAGWWEQEPGIFVRWCTESCPNNEVIGANSYWLMEVWCRERACGDLYAQINIENRQGQVVGWTNDTGFGDHGAKVVLTFQKHSVTGRSSASLVKFNARGLR